MHVRSRNLPGLPVLTLSDGNQVGRVQKPVIDPKEKRVAALLLAGPGIKGKRFLPIESVHALGSHAVTIGTVDSLKPLKEDEKLLALLKTERVKVLGSPVVTAGGDLVGSVRDFEIGASGTVKSLYVSQGVWNAVTGHEVAIVGELLIALGRDAVVVADEAFKLVAGRRQEIETDKEPGGTSRRAAANEEPESRPAKPRLALFRKSEEHEKDEDDAAH